MSTWNKHYHWKTKGCTPWSKQYFTDRLVGQSVTAGDGIEVRIDRLESFDGDVELGNRKGKLITIYDVDMHLSWTASSSSSTSDSSSPIAKGKLRFPEVSHEIEDQGDDYTWETTLDAAEGEAGADEKQRQVAYKAVKKDLAEKLLPVFKEFRKTLVDKHARDLGHEEGQSSGTSTPGGASAGGAAPAAAAAAPQVDPPKAKATPSSSTTVSSDVVELSASQACSQSDLWDLLTNPSRIPLWTRSPADFTPTPDSPFSLFGGNVRGKVLTVTEPSKLTMEWRPPTWEPADYHGVLELRLAQQEGSTLLTIRLEGAPQGEEESSRRALEEFYVNGLKRLGLGAMI